MQMIFQWYWECPHPSPYTPRPHSPHTSKLNYSIVILYYIYNYI